MSRLPVIYFLLLWLTCLGHNHVRASFKFNTLDCEFLSEEFGRINVCEIKTVDRRRNMINFEAVLAKTATQFELKFKMFKRVSAGWQPFMYDFSVDICQFFKNPNKFFIPNFLYTFVQAYTNINHTCPYLSGSTMRVWNFTPDEDGVLAKFPVEQGQYGLNTTYYINKVPALHFNGTLSFFK